MEVLKNLFKDRFGCDALSCDRLTPAGSDRSYYRLTCADGRSAVGVAGTSQAENRAFCAIAAHLRAKGLNVPQVFCSSDNSMAYLQSDLGDESLYGAIAKGRGSGHYSEPERRLLRQTIACLPALQFLGAEGLDFSVCYPQSSFDGRGVMFDLNYFKYDYLKLTAVQFNETSLQDDFEHLAADILEAKCPTGFMYRDFQARNVMLCGGKPWFIDFQGGRLGPVCYDVASFVYQASARYPEDLKKELVETYIVAAKPYADLDTDDFRASLRLFVLLRTLQVLGAYGFRGYIEKKGHFIASVPYALENAAQLLLDGVCAPYPELERVLSALVASQTRVEKPADSRLTVEVTSFSYRLGLPQDSSGNGGGYVYDCRALENPGRYEAYKKSNGLDRNVIDFLEEEGGILVYLDRVKGQVYPHIRKYVERGFAHLMVCFGCTGGQHRSVYLAQHFAEAVAADFDVHVIVRHTALKIENRLK